MTEPEIWGELGPAMRELNSMQQDFVRALVATKPGWGAVTRAAREAGYGKNSKAATLSKHAYHMSRDERIIAAVAEESKKVLRLGHAEAVSALLNVVRSPDHRDHMRGVTALLDRVDPIVSKHSVDVVHRREDPDRAALEELKALRKLGTPRTKLLELYGPNGLDRLEALESVELAQRSIAAKVIEHEPIDVMPEGGEPDLEMLGDEA
jgi:hypothetical protein